MSAAINRALAIKELQDLVGLTQKQMLEYLDYISPYKEQLFRNPSKAKKAKGSRSTVNDNLILKTADKIKNTSNIDNCALLLEYAFRRVFQRPCHGLKPIDMFLKLFQEAINYKYNDTYDVDYLTEIREQADAKYKSDSNFVDSEFQLYPREMAEKQFDILSKQSNRFKNYIEMNKNPIDQIEDKISSNPIPHITGSIISNDKMVSLEEIVFPPIGSSWTHSVSLCGKGGSGKTYQLLKLINSILNNTKKYGNIIPLYIELNDITNDDNECLVAILSKYFKVTTDTITSVLDSHKNNIVLFCDGLNEVTDGNIRTAIADSICRLMASYKTRIILSSRDDHSSLFNYSGFADEQRFIKASVPPLTKEQIKSYFRLRNVNKEYDKLPLSTQKLLETAQGLSMYTELILNDSSLDFHNMAQLIQTYSDKILKIDRNNQNDRNNKFEILLKEAAYVMARFGVFQISRENLHNIIGSRNLEKYIANNRIATIFAPDLSNNYQFSHQSFRDFYCSSFLAAQIKSIHDLNIQDKNSYFEELKLIINKYLQNNYVNESPDIIEMCSSLLNSDDLQFFIDAIKKYPNDDIDLDYPISLLIRLFALINNNSIATLDLSSLDLSNISLVNYLLYSMENENVYVKLNNSTISEKTFSGNGLQSASSTICRYEIEGKEYIAAFSTTNILVYDISENSWDCIRNLENRGWINCCCVVEEHDKVSVFLGCDTGDIKVFIPSERTVTLIYENKGDRECGIETLIPINKGTILYSDAYGNVFSLQGNKITQIRKTEEIELEHARKLFLAKSKSIFDDYLVFDKELGLLSRLALSKKQKYLYLCFANSIYRYEMPLSKDKKFELFKTYNDNTIIRDIIYTSRGILVNKLCEISYLSDNGHESKSFSLENPEALEYFTKFSPTEDENTAIIGVSPRYSDFSKISNFFKVYNKKTTKRVSGSEIARGLHTKTTYTGAVYRIPGTASDKYKIATVADDRAVQFLSHNDENLETILHKGCYDGIRNISFISDNQMLLAQYDGSISYWRKEDERWQCFRVYNAHTDWVWAVKHLGKDLLSDHNFEIISCSFDGSLKRTKARTGETTTLIPGTKQKSMIDLSVIGVGNEIFSITEKKAYMWSFKDKGKSLPKAIDMSPNWTNYILRSIDCIDGKPFIALKATLTDNTEQCYIMGWDNNHFYKILDCEKTCGFIRGIRTYKLCGKSLLVIYGHNKGEQYFAFYFYENFKLQYKGSIIPDNDNSKNFKTSINLTSLNDAKAYKMITDIAVRTNTANIENGTLSFEMYVIHRNRQFRAYTVEIGTDNTTISEMNNLPILTINPAPSQPLCIGICNNTIAVGQLDGTVTTNTLDSLETPPIDFVTHANLNACVSIDIENVKFKNTEEEENFHKTFDGYFTF